MSTPHNATLYSSAAQSTPAQTAAENAAEVLAAQGSYSGSARQSVEDYQLLAGLRPGPDPVITALTPHEAEVVAIPEDMSVTVTGENFYNGWSAVVWNGVTLPTTFVSATELHVEDAPSSDTVDVVEVYVRNSDVSRSVAVTFDYIDSTP